MSVAGTLREKIAAIADAGFDALELYEPDLAASGETPRNIARMVADHGLRLALLQPLRDFEGLPEPRRAQAFDAARRMFDLMGALEADLLLVCSSVAADAQPEPARIAEDMAALGELASTHRIRVGYEALSWASHIRDHNQAWNIVERCNRTNVGLILDSFQILAFGADVEPIRKMDGERIFHAQIADAPIFDIDRMTLSRRHRKLPGQGNLDLDLFMDALRATTYNRLFSIEIFRDLQNDLPRATESLAALRYLLEGTSGRRQRPDII